MDYDVFLIYTYEERQNGFYKNIAWKKNKAFKEI